MTQRKSLNPNDLKDISKFKTRVDRRQNFEVVGDQIIGIGQKEKAVIVRAHHMMVKKGYARPNTADPSTATVAGLFLEAVGINVLEKRGARHYNADFSLLDRNRNAQDGGNPNIEDPNLRNLENYQQEGRDVFTNPDDPFYELDGRRSRNSQLQQTDFIKKNKGKAMTSLARNVAKTNLDKTTPSLKYFK